MELQDTIVLVSSSEDPKTFGTGFVVHADEERSYVVTCAHVVRDIQRENGETGRILVGSVAADVAAKGEVDEIDLAVLRLTLTRRWDRKPLRLREAGRLGAAIRVAGQCEKEKHSACVAEWLEGHLAKEICLTSPKSTVRGWQLAFRNTDRVQPGYSGGAVVLGDAVIGVAAIQLLEQNPEAVKHGITALPFITELRKYH